MSGLLLRCDQTNIVLCFRSLKSCAEKQYICRSLNGKYATMKAREIDAVRNELRDILLRAYGADGVEKHTRLQGLRKMLKQAWSESGVARKETEEFLDEICAATPIGPVRETELR